MNTILRKLAFTLPFFLAAGLVAVLLAVMYPTAVEAVFAQMPTRQSEGGQPSIEAAYRPSNAALSSHVIYVDVDAAGLAIGLSWTDAYTNLQDALLDASVPVPTSTVEIWVAEGVYYPDVGAGQINDAVTSTFHLASDVEIYGGFTATETLRTQRDWEAHVTVLSGDLGQNDTTDVHGVVTDTANLTGNNAYHVVKGGGTDATAVLDGFSITAGQANGGYDFYPCGSRCGGGMYSVGGSPTLANVSFISNVAAEAGAGMFNYNSSPTLTNVSFSGNWADYGGGGMLNWTSSPTLDNVNFSGNAAVEFAGGMVNYQSNPSLTNVTFSGNVAGQDGGGMYNDQSNPAIRNSILWNNQDGGGLDASAQISNSNGTPVISYSLVMGSGGSGFGWDSSLGTDGGGNLYADPLFVVAVDPNDAPTIAGDLHLLSASPAIDAGEDSYVIASTDLDGEPRIDGNAVDMGAYEHQVTPNLATIPDQTMDEYQTLTVNVSASDPNGDDLSLSFTNLPAFASADDNGDGTGVITFTTGFDDAGVYPNLQVTASDPDGFSDTGSFTLTVLSGPKFYLPLVVR